MTNGIYGYYDTKNEYIAYIGQDGKIDKEKRHKEHMAPSLHDNQKINMVLQNNPERYVYFKFVEGNYTQEEINDFEKEAIRIFKTFKEDYPEKSVFNFTRGGDGVNSYKHTEETRKYLSELVSGEKNPNYGRTGEKHPMYGKHHTKSVKKGISKTMTSTGIYRVCKHKNSNYKQGFYYDYIYFVDNERKVISSIYLKELEHKVREQGLDWIIINENLAQETLNESEKLYNEYVKNHPTGYYRVSKQYNNQCKQGFTYVYYYSIDGKTKSISSVNLNKLEEKVKAKGLPWYKL